jgi:UDP-glucose 4-epimerase
MLLIDSHFCMKKNKKKLYIITGVAGMVGSTLLPRILLKKNSIVVGIDNLKLGKIKFIKAFLNKKNFIFLKLNLDKNIKNIKLRHILDNYKLVEIWHLAANSDIQAGTKNPKVDYCDTFLTTFNILNFVKPYIKVNSKIIFSSSSAIYGSIGHNINEKSAPFLPESSYGAMKLASEAFISSYSFSNKIKSFIFRFPNVIGKNLTHGVIFDLSKKILLNSKELKVLGNGEQCKPYSSVNEIIDCMMYLTKIKNYKLVNYYNIGTNDKGVKVKDIVKLLIKKFNYKKKVIYEKNNIGWKGDIPAYSYSTKKINKLGYKFKLNSILALKKTINAISKKTLI